MKGFLVSERAKWLLAIGVIAIGTGFVAKSVILYPEECNLDLTATSFIGRTNGVY